MRRTQYRRDDHTKLGLAILAGALVALVFLSDRGLAADYTAEDTLSAINQASIDTGTPIGQLMSIVRCETGGTFNPYAEGDRGHSHGAAQLNDYGNALSTFYAIGYTDPYDPYQSMYFMAEVLRGDHPPLGRHSWNC